jgi:phage-related tail protein
MNSLRIETNIRMEPRQLFFKKINEIKKAIHDVKEEFNRYGKSQKKSNANLGNKMFLSQIKNTVESHSTDWNK